jgi:hypothetical protein
MIAVDRNTDKLQDQYWPIRSCSDEDEGPLEVGQRLLEPAKLELIAGGGVVRCVRGNRFPVSAGRVQKECGGQPAATVEVLPNEWVVVEVEEGVHGPAFEYGKAGD